MSIRIALERPPEFYTNLDLIQGRVILSLGRHENVAAIIVKLEGESKTALAAPQDGTNTGLRQTLEGGQVLSEDHKILYRVQQVFPDANTAADPGPYILAPGQHYWPFRFKVPFNNACSDAEAMSRIGGINGVGGFGLGGIRVMDGTKQLMYQHVKRTLPPSFTGFPRQAEIRYYIKVTIQRPSLFKENWRYQVGLKFLPMEPPRPPRNDQEAYARRPFTFRPRSAGPPVAPSATSRLSAAFGNLRTSKSHSSLGQSDSTPATPISPTADGKLGPLLEQQPPQPGPEAAPPSAMAPSIEMSARLPHPSILTCNKPIPLRLIAKKLVPSREMLYLSSLQIVLVGLTQVRATALVNTETTRWIILSRQGLSIPLCDPEDPVGRETVIPDALWRDVPLPNTVMPSFVTCNLSRSYQLQLQISVCWGKPDGGGKKGKGPVPQELHYPLHFSKVEVYSGVTPPPELVDAVLSRPKPTGGAPGRRPSQTHVPQQQQQPHPNHAAGRGQRPPPLPNRPAPYDPLYPPQLAPGQAAPPYDDAPPSYDEAVAETVTGPVFPDGARPAYSGVTNENAPDSIPSKS